VYLDTIGTVVVRLFLRGLKVEGVIIESVGSLKNLRSKLNQMELEDVVAGYTPHIFRYHGTSTMTVYWLVVWNIFYFSIYWE
jgi:hypothetical protein